jgi:hypothetical protein
MFIETPFDGPIRGGEDDGSAGAKFGDWSVFGRVMDGGAADACMKDCVYELLFDL